MAAMDELLGQVLETVAENADTSQSPESSAELLDGAALPVAEAAEQITPEPEALPLPLPEIHVKVSSDSMTVYLRVKVFDESQEVELPAVMEALKNNGVIFGVLEETVKRFCEEKNYFAEIVAARGLPAVDGISGDIQYHFRTDDTITLKEAEDGTVDYREMGFVQNVQKGEALVTVIPPTPGVDGINVFGGRVAFLVGKSFEAQGGENTVFSEDNSVLHAAIDGCIEYKNGVVSVNDIFTVKGDVCSGTGNIDCTGSVVVMGDVLAGFRVVAKKDIIVKGMIEGATIIAGGTVTISNGMNGLGGGKIEAGGDIVSKYFEHAKIECGGSVMSDVIINSEIHAVGSILLKGGKSSLIGGRSYAGKSVVAAYIGSSSNSNTYIEVDCEELRRMLVPAADNNAEVSRLTDEIGLLLLRQEELQARMDGYSRDISNPESKILLKETMREKSNVTGEIASLEKLIEGFNKQASFLYEYKVVATKVCFSGTRITIGYVPHNVSSDDNVAKYYTDGQRIILAQATPADKA